MNIIWFKDCSYKNSNIVGGKNASLGELLNLSSELNFNISDGFALTTHLYDSFLQNNNLNRFIELSQKINVNNISELNNFSNTIKKKIIEKGHFTDKQIDEIKLAYNTLKNKYKGHIGVAIRSSSIAEDLPNASFAGQQDTYLNINTFDDLLKYTIKCYASLFNARAISYRHTNNIHYNQVKCQLLYKKWYVLIWALPK